SEPVRDAAAVAPPDRRAGRADLPDAPLERPARRAPAAGPGDRRALASGCGLAAAPAVVEIALGRTGANAARDGARAGLAPHPAGVRRPGAPQPGTQRRRDPA